MKREENSELKRQDEMRTAENSFVLAESHNSVQRDERQEKSYGYNFYEEMRRDMKREENCKTNLFYKRIKRQDEMK